MKAYYYPTLLSLVLLFCTACSKDKETDNTKITDSYLLSNISESPDLLLGSWNLSDDEDSNKSITSCQATNLHFLENNIFYLNYLDKRIKGKYEIIDSISVNLLNGSNIIGTATQIEIVEDEISLALEIVDECTENFTGLRYFRIHQFIWEALNDYYLWQGEVPALNDSIKPVGSSIYNELIEPYPEPEAFFNSLKHQEDKYSLIRSDYVDLENSIRG
ncbi:MAG: hypothetical protein HOK17_13025, partial [Flammeovirgaceae bacterium]|nr:hypothetical protein [Flammeovirgaceae bacterium]